MKFDYEDHEKMLRFWALIALVLGCIAVALFVTSCRQMPVLRGPYEEDKVAQARVDSKQSDRIADLTDIEDGMGTVLTVIAPDEVKPQTKALQTKITAVRTKATVQAEQHRERAEQAERKLEETNAAPGATAWLGSLLTGNWSGLVDLLIGALGVGGLAQASRLKSRANRLADKALQLADMEPEAAKRVAESDPDLVKHKRRKSS